MIRWTITFLILTIFIAWRAIEAEGLDSVILWIFAAVGFSYFLGALLVVIIEYVIKKG